MSSIDHPGMLLSPEQYGTEGERLLGEGNYEAAIEQFSLAIQADPKDTRGYSSRAMAYIRMNELEKAVRDLDQVIALQPDMWQAHANRASAYVNSGRPDVGIQDYTQAI